MSLPDQDPAAREAALKKAAAARRVRAEVKMMLQSGEVTLTQLLERADTSDVLARMRVAEVVAALPGMGSKRTAALMEELGIPENRRLRGLGHRQREGLLAATTR